MLAMLEAGKSQREVAAIFDVNESTVSRIVSKWTPVAELAERRAKALSIEAVESLERAFAGAEKLGKHGPQEAILKVAGLMKSDADLGGPRVLVQIGVRDGDVQIATSATAGPAHNQLGPERG